MSTNPRIATSFFGTIFIGFGINAIIRPENALSFFELPYATIPPAHKQLVDALLAVYGVRDIFMGLVLYLASYFGDRRTLGWVVLAAAGVGFADGAVCKWMIGAGEFNHWGYAPVLVMRTLPAFNPLPRHDGGIFETYVAYMLTLR